MKNIIPNAILVLSFLLSNCNKSTTDTQHINCDGLVTDTTGTNDQAKIYMPTAFTPNGDALNDILHPAFSGISSMTLTIYDDNYAVIFTTNQLNQGWNPLPIANSAIRYYYKIQATTTANHQVGECGEVYSLSCLPGNLSISSLHFQDQLTQNGFTLTTHEVIQACH